LEDESKTQAHGGLTEETLERARNREAEKLEQVGTLETECRARAGEDAEDVVIERTGRGVSTTKSQERNGPSKTVRPAGDGAPGGAGTRGGERALAGLTALLVQRYFVRKKASKSRFERVAAGQPVSTHGPNDRGAGLLEKRGTLRGERTP